MCEIDKVPVLGCTAKHVSNYLLGPKDTPITMVFRRGNEKIVVHLLRQHPCKLPSEIMRYISGDMNVFNMSLFHTSQGMQSYTQLLRLSFVIGCGYLLRRRTRSAKLPPT